MSEPKSPTHSQNVVATAIGAGIVWLCNLIEDPEMKNAILYIAPGLTIAAVGTWGWFRKIGVLEFSIRQQDYVNWRAKLALKKLLRDEFVSEVQKDKAKELYAFHRSNLKSLGLDPHSFGDPPS